MQSSRLSLLLPVLLGPSVRAECHCLSGCLIKFVDWPKGAHINKALLSIEQYHLVSCRYHGCKGFITLSYRSVMLVL